LQPVGPTQSETIVFIGNLRSVQNQDACVHFVNDIFPSIRERLPHARFRIVGDGPRRFIDKMNTTKGVEALGRVESISDAVRGAFCGVCPVRIGAGVQNKVLEYFALALPAVISPVGLEGIPAVPGRDVIVAGSPSAMANEILRLHANPSLRNRVAHNGLRLVREKMTWAQNLAGLCKNINTLLGITPARTEGNASEADTVQQSRPEMWFPPTAPLDDMNQVVG
jgi:glycosyltransferase involved in cell wall biosynthesis